MKISAGSADIGKPLCLYDENDDAIALMSNKRPNIESTALHIVRAVNSYDAMIDLLDDAARQLGASEYRSDQAKADEIEKFLSALSSAKSFGGTD